MASFRKIEAISMAGLDPAPMYDRIPEIEWVDPLDLYVNEHYQRDLSERSVRQVRRIFSEWSWRKFKPPVVSRTKNGLEVIDGQHTAIGAACNPYVKKIPVLIVDAANEAERAEGFLSHNRDRVAITPMQLFHGAVVAGDEVSVAVKHACDAAGVKVLRTPPSKGNYPVGSTIAIKSIAKLLTSRGDEAAIRVLKCLYDANCAPIGSAQVKAAEALLFDPEFGVADKKLSETIRDGGLEVEREAGIMAATHNIPMWRALIIVYYRRCSGRRRRAA